MSATVRTSADLSADARITLGGAPLDPALGQRLIELRVETTTGLPDVCVLRLAEDEVASADSEDLKVIDDKRLAIGASVRVALKAAGAGALEVVFSGEITTIEADLEPGSSMGPPHQELIVTAHDRSHRMHRATTMRTLRQMTVIDVVRKVAAEHGLRIGKLAALGGGPSEVLHQVGESDWAFVSRLVREHGGELDVEGDMLHVVDPVTRLAPVAELVWGESLRRFRARASALAQVDKVVVRSWDPSRKQGIEKSAKPVASSAAQKQPLAAALSGTAATVTTARVATDGQATAQAQALAMRVGHERVQAEALSTGDPRLLAGSTVTVRGVGRRFGGDHRIVSAVHVLGHRGYETRLTLGAGGRPIAETTGHATTAAPAFSAHLVVGVVTSNTDPKKLGRVKVRYVTLGDSVESDWARVARGAAGKERGAVALPHVNDEVVVGFEHGDVHKPFVLGVLFNGIDTPGADLVDAANSYAARFPRDLDVATKTKTVLAAEKGITAEAATGPIELTSGAAITVKAGQQAPAALTLETKGQIKANGQLGAEIVAMGPIKISGNAPVTIESSAVLQLKGSAVQIQGTGVVQISGAQVILG